MSNNDTSTSGPGALQRIIEAQMPLTKISFQSAREKSIRHGHLSTLHIWWARRPLAACRAAIFAALVPQPEDPTEAKKLQTFIGELTDWDHSIDSDIAIGGKEAHHYIQDARAYIRQAFLDRAPRILDPFAGGGAIPLEALRLGCETYALDLNPVAHIIQLATLVYPQKYAHRPGPYGEKPGATLAGDVQKWGKWVLDKAREEIGDLYPKDADGATTVAYLWARTILCPNPACGVPVPLIRQTWLARRTKKYVAYKIESDGPGIIPSFHISQVQRAGDFDFDPAIGTTLGGIAACPSCGTPLSENHIVSTAQAGQLGALPIAVVTDGPTGKRYRDVLDNDREIFKKAEERLWKLINDYDPLSGELRPIPDESLPPPGTLGFRVQRYGFKTWEDLFNARQALVLATFSRLVRTVHQVITKETGDVEYAKAVATYLGINVDRQADYNSSFCRWVSAGEFIGNTFGRQALPMIWDYAEVNPFSGLTGDWDGAIDWVRRTIEHNAASGKPADVRRGSANQLPYEDNYFDAVITDPPYYDNVPYSDLSDFFYVWLRRSIGEFYPTVLSTPLTPKQQEIVQDPVKSKSKEDFERMLGEAFAESARVLKDEGICVVVYAHKAVSAWESLVAALLQAGLTVDGSWPFSTEMANRLRGMDSAALASSIFLVCRKRKTDAGVGIAGPVREEITRNVHQRLDDFWEAGLRGADFFISAIGPATAAFSRYEKVMTMGGDTVTVSTLLEWVQETVADYALQRVFAPGRTEGQDAEAGLGVVDDETRFYVMWRWTYDGQGSIVGVKPGNGATETEGAADETGVDASDDSGGTGKGGSKKIPFGDALLMAVALGADIQSLIHRDHILEGSSTVKLLSPAERERLDANLGEPRADGSHAPLIDILHRAELLWARDQPEALQEYLDDVLPGDREVLRRVAQSLVDLLPRGDEEKKWLEGFLNSRAAQDAESKDGQRGRTTQTTLAEEFAPYVVKRGKGRKR